MSASTERHHGVWEIWAHVEQLWPLLSVKTAPNSFLDSLAASCSSDLGMADQGHVVLRICAPGHAAGLHARNEVP